MVTYEKMLAYLDASDISYYETIDNAIVISCSSSLLNKGGVYDCFAKIEKSNPYKREPEIIIGIWGSKFKKEKTQPLKGFAKLANESFKARPIAKATVPKDTNKPEVDNSKTEAATKTARITIKILTTETTNVKIAPSTRVFEKIFLIKKPMSQAIQTPTTTIHIASINLKPYSDIYPPI